MCTGIPPRWGQYLDTCHHWHQYRDPHAAELISQTMQHQLHEAQPSVNEESMLQFQQWLQTGHNKGLRGLFRSLKSSELASERPYRQTPTPQRMEWNRGLETEEHSGTSGRTTTTTRGTGTSTRTGTSDSRTPQPSPQGTPRQSQSARSCLNAAPA